MPSMSPSAATIAAARTGQKSQSAALLAAESSGVSSRPSSAAPRTPRVIAATGRKTAAAMATPPTMLSGIVRRGSLISLAMIAVRMKPSQDQKKIAAPASTPSAPLLPRSGPSCAGSTACAAAPA